MYDARYKRSCATDTTLTHKFRFQRQIAPAFLPDGVSRQTEYQEAPTNQGGDTRVSGMAMRHVRREIQAIMCNRHHTHSTNFRFQRQIAPAFLPDGVSRQTEYQEAPTNQGGDTRVSGMAIRHVRREIQAIMCNRHHTHLHNFISKDKSLQIFFQTELADKPSIRKHLLIKAETLV